MIADFNVYGGDAEMAAELQTKVSTGLIGEPSDPLLVDENYPLNISKWTYLCLVCFLIILFRDVDLSTNIETFLNYHPFLESLLFV